MVIGFFSFPPESVKRGRQTLGRQIIVRDNKSQVNGKSEDDQSVQLKWFI